MRPAQFLATAALACAALLMPAPSSAQQRIESLDLTVTTTPAVVSDYLFRGVSQTRGRPAVQATIDIEHGSGLYVGGFVSNVSFPGTDIRQEVDLNLGYRFALGGVKLDLGATYFWYPGYDRPGDFDWSWYEITLRGSYEIAPVKLVGQIAYAPNFNYESGTAIYVEGGLDLALDFGFTASVRVGHQWVQRNTRWGAPDYTVFSFGVSRELVAGIIGAVTLSHTTLDDRSSECFGGLALCGTRFVASASRPF